MKKKASANKRRSKNTTATLTPRRASRVKGGVAIMEKYDATAKGVIYKRP